MRSATPEIRTVRRRRPARRIPRGARRIVARRPVRNRKIAKIPANSINSPRLRENRATTSSRDIEKV